MHIGGILRLPAVADERCHPGAGGAADVRDPLHAGNLLAFCAS